MASLMGIRVLTRQSGTLRNSLNQFLLRSAITQLQRHEKFLHSSKTSTPVFTRQVIGNFRFYSTATKDSPKDIEERVMKVIAAYDKISADKLTKDSHFMTDLGLDSLDHVEVIMAIEDEFGFEVPDMDAGRLMKPADIIRYIADREDVYE